MATTFRVIALSSLDIEGTDVRGEPELLYPEALIVAQEFQAQGKAFRVIAKGEFTDERERTFRDLGAVD